MEQPQMRDYFAQLGKVIVQCSMFMYEIPFSTFSSCNIRGLAIWRGAPLWKPPQTRTQANGASQGREVFRLVHLPFFKYICFFYFKSSTRTFLHTKAQHVISPADRLLIKHIQFNSNTSSSYNCLDSYLKLFGFLLKCSVFERFPFS